MFVEFWHFHGAPTHEVGSYVSLFTCNYFGVKEEECKDWWLLLHRALGSVSHCRESLLLVVHEMISGDLQTLPEDLLLVTAWPCPADNLFCPASANALLSPHLMRHRPSLAPLIFQRAPPLASPAWVSRSTLPSSPAPAACPTQPPCPLSPSSSLGLLYRHGLIQLAACDPILWRFSASLQSITRLPALPTLCLCSLCPVSWVLRLSLLPASCTFPTQEPPSCLLSLLSFYINLFLPSVH